MNDSAAGTIAPFFTIWLQPRATIRQIVATDPNRFVFALAATNSALGVLEGQWLMASSGATLPTSWPIIVAAQVAVGALFGIVALQFNAWLFRWASEKLGGTATRVEVRTAIAWALVPAIVGASIAIAALLLGAIEPPEISMSSLAAMNPLFSKFGAIQSPFGLWSAIV